MVYGYFWNSGGVKGKIMHFWDPSQWDKMCFECQISMKKKIKMFIFSYGQCRGGWPPPPLRSEGRKISVFFYACPLIVGDKKNVKFRSHWMTMGWWLGRVFDGIIMSWKIYKSKLTLLFQLGWLCLWLLWTLIPCYFTSSKFLTPFKPVQAWEFDAKGHLNFANFA